MGPALAADEEDGPADADGPSLGLLGWPDAEQIGCWQRAREARTGATAGCTAAAWLPARPRQGPAPDRTPRLMLHCMVAAAL